MFLQPHPETELVVSKLVDLVRGAIERGRARDRRAPLALVAVAGTAAVGKTSLSKRLVDAAGVPAAIIATDGYMLERKDRRKRGITGPNPEANDLARLSRDLQRVKRGDTTEILARIETPDGRKSVETPFSPAPLTIVEGLVALYPQVEVEYDLAIFIDGPAEDELSVRLDRDVTERHHPKDEVTSVFWLRQGEYDRFLRPTARRADVRLWAERRDDRYRLSFR